MGKGIWIGENNAAHVMKQGWIGVDGVARKIKNIWIGVDNVARLCWQSVIERYSQFKHFIYKSHISYEPYYYTHIDGVYSGIEIAKNTYLLKCGIRNNDGSYFEDGIMQIIIDDDSNIIDMKTHSFSYDVVTFCKTNNYHVVGTTDYSSSQIYFTSMDTIRPFYTSIHGTVNNIYALNDSSVYGVLNNSDANAIELFITNYNSSDNTASTNYVTLINNASSPKLIHVSNNQNLLFYYINGGYYIAPLIVNNIDSYALGSPQLIPTNFLSNYKSPSYVIDDNHIVLCSYDNYAIGVYVKDNNISLSATLNTGVNNMCRIGKSKSFFGFITDTSSNEGKIIYYDSSSNSFSIINNSITPVTTNISGYFSQSGVLVPKGKNGITYFISGNSEYFNSYDLQFEV